MKLVKKMTHFLNLTVINKIKLKSGLKTPISFILSVFENLKFNHYYPL
jgi:hypothetical protein